MIPVGYITTIRELERNEGYIYIFFFDSKLLVDGTSFRFLIIRISFIKSYTPRRYSYFFTAMIYAPIDYYSILTRPITFPIIKQEYYSSNYNVLFQAGRSVFIHPILRLVYHKSYI